MQKNNITIEEIRKKQGFTELQTDPLRCQELQCDINSRTHLRNLTIKTKTTIDDHPQVSNGIHHEISSVLKNKLDSTMPTAEFEINIACDLWGLSNNPFSPDYREIAAKSSLSAEIISSKSFLSPDK
jgi:hypothetical protein